MIYYYPFPNHQIQQTGYPQKLLPNRLHAHKYTSQKLFEKSHFKEL